MINLKQIIKRFISLTAVITILSGYMFNAGISTSAYLDMADEGTEEFGFLVDVFAKEFSSTLTITNSESIIIRKDINGELVIFNYKYAEFSDYIGSLDMPFYAKIDNYTITAVGKSRVNFSKDNFTSVETNGNVIFTVNKDNNKVTITSKGKSYVRVYFENKINSSYDDEISRDIFEIAFRGYLNDGESITTSLTGTYEKNNLIFNVSTDNTDGFSISKYTPRSGSHYYYVSNLNKLDGINLINEFEFPSIKSLTTGLDLIQSYPFEGNFSNYSKLSKGFSPDIYFYIANVSNKTSSVKFKPTLDEEVTAQINTGSGYKNFSKATNIPLAVGQNDIEIKVTEPGKLEAIYRLRITRESGSGSVTPDPTPMPSPNPSSSSSTNSLAAVKTPVSSIKSGQYTGSIKIKLTSATPDAKIYYSTDGSTPTTKSMLYTGEFTINKSMTVKAIAVKSGYSNSSITEYIYTIKTNRPILPDVEPKEGSVKIKITAPKNTIVYYTTDNSKPTTKSKSIPAGVSRTLTIIKDTTIKAFAVKSGCIPSSISKKDYQVIPLSEILEN